MYKYINVKYININITFSGYINGKRLAQTLYYPAGLSATCVLRQPNSTVEMDPMNLTSAARDRLLNRGEVSRLFNDGCLRVFQKGVKLENFVPPPQYIGRNERDLMNATNAGQICFANDHRCTWG